MAKWDKYSVKSILNKIEKRELLLPVIQRELVWDEDKVISLFQTLCLGDSFGGIMTVRDVKSQERNPLFRVRTFIRDYVDGNDYGSADESFENGDLEYVIDGQQRLSAIYIGFLGSYNRKRLYFNLTGNCANDEFIFMFAENFAHLPDTLPDDCDGAVHPTVWISIRELFDKIKSCPDARRLSRSLLRTRTGLSTEEQERFEDNVSRMAGVISDDCVGVCEVALDVTRDEKDNRLRIVHLFQKLNQGGTVLSGIELMRSKLKALNADNEKFLTNVKDEYADIGLDQDGIIRYVFLLQDQVNKDIVDICDADSDFITQNEVRIYASLDALRKFLEHEGLADYVKTWRVSSVPMYLLAYYLYHQNVTVEELREYFEHDIRDENRLRISKWIHMTFLNRAFQRGRGWDPNKTGRRLVFELLSATKGGYFPLDEIIKLYHDRLHWFDPEPKDDETNLNQYERSYVLYSMYGKAMLSRKNDVDHIIAKHLLELKGYPPEKINTLSNYEPLFFRENRSKQDQELLDWLNEKYGDNEIEKARFSKLHYLPNDRSLWNSDRYEEFLANRRSLIIDKIKSLV